MDKKIFIDHYQAALAQYREKNWDMAIKEFQECLKWVPSDAASELLIGRCRLYKSNPPPENWDGVFL